MFREIGIATGHCGFCREYGTVAVLVAALGEREEKVPGCERCWRATGNAANLLRLVRLGKSPKAKATPKKNRKPGRGQPSAIQAHRDGPEHGEGSSLASVADASP